MDKEYFVESVFNSSILNRFQSDEWIDTFRAGIEAAYDQILNLDLELLTMMSVLSMQRKIEKLNSKPELVIIGKNESFEPKFPEGGRVIVLGKNDFLKREAVLFNIERLKENQNLIPEMFAYVDDHKKNGKRKKWEPPYKFHK